MQKSLLVSLILLSMIAASCSSVRDINLQNPSASGNDYAPKFRNIVTISSSLGRGSGFFVSPDLILTDYHVVEHQHNISVQLFSGAVVEAKIVRESKERDVALLKIGRQFQGVDGLSMHAYAGSADSACGEEEPIDTQKQTIFQRVQENSIYFISIIDHRQHYGKIEGKDGLCTHEKRTIRALLNDAQEGDSGGPVFNFNGDVIGVIVSGPDAKLRHSSANEYLPRHIIPIEYAFEYLHIKINNIQPHNSDHAK